MRILITFLIYARTTFPLYKQEAQLMLTTGSTRLAVSRGQQTWYHFGLRLFAKHVTATTRHNSVAYR